MLAVGAGPQRTPDPTVPQLLTAAGAYIADYERSFATIVSEERYEQTANMAAARGGPSRRVMKSDLLTYHSGDAGWIAFRDVVEVDGVPVPDRTERLLKLVYEPTSHALDDALRSTIESGRYNIGNMARTINVPTIGLVFLRRENQARAAFEFDGMKTLGTMRVALVKFRERSTPRMILTPDNTAATGRFWIEPDSGRVIQTEFTLTSRRYSARIVVEYADQPKLAVWVPVRMVEEYETSDDRTLGRSVGRPPTVNGEAVYQNFRKFETSSRLIRKN